MSSVLREIKPATYLYLPTYLPTYLKSISTLLSSSSDDKWIDFYFMNSPRGIHEPWSRGLQEEKNRQSYSERYKKNPVPSLKIKSSNYFRCEEISGRSGEGERRRTKMRMRRPTVKIG